MTENHPYVFVYVAPVVWDTLWFGTLGGLGHWCTEKQTWCILIRPVALA